MKGGMISKAEANYREATSTSSRRCGNCTMFVRLHQTCTLVRGAIDPDAVCDHFEAKRKAA